MKSWYNEYSDMKVEPVDLDRSFSVKEIRAMVEESKAFENIETIDYIPFVVPMPTEEEKYALERIFAWEKASKEKPGIVLR